MYKKSNIISIFVLFLSFFFGCANETGPAPGVNEFMVNASSWADSVWTYFSFDAGDTVRPSDPENSTDWDLKFQRYRIGTNSGTSGPGEGGALNVEKVDFDSYNQVPESGYVVDTMVTFAGMDTFERSCNPVLSDWWTMEGYILDAKDTVFAVKSAEGNYTKMQILDYYYIDEEKNSHSGYIAFQYVYQPDGSRSFE